MTRVIAVVVAAVILMTGCSGPKGSTVGEKRAYIQNTTQNTLKEFYERNPELKGKVSRAAGYGVFSNIGTNVIFVTTGSGYGIVRNNKTGDEFYMKMAEVGLGIGLGVKDFRALFIFNSEDVISKFVYSGWEFGAEADAAAKAGEKGGAANVEGSLGSDIELYQLTKNGLALQANVGGTKYWRDDALNQ